MITTIQTINILWQGLRTEKAPCHMTPRIIISEFILIPYE